MSLANSPCASNDNIGCQHVCYVENNVKKCSCNKGYELEGDNKNCKGNIGKFFARFVSTLI
jgi:hypothetical protein